MITFIKKHAGALAFAIGIIICLFFFVYILNIGTEYSRNINEQAADVAKNYATEQALYIASQCDIIKNDADFLAGQISECHSQEEFDSTFYRAASGYIVDNSYIDVLYYKGDNFYKITGPVTVSEQISSLKNSKTTIFSKVFAYGDGDMSISAIKAVDSPYCDGVAFVRSVHTILLKESMQNADGSYMECVQNSEFSLLCKQDGIIIEKIALTDSFSFGNGSVFDILFNDIFITDSDYKAATNAFSKSGITTFVFKHDVDDYVLATGSPFNSDSSISLVSVFKVKKIYGQAYDIVQNIWASLLGLAFIMVIMIAIIVITRYRARKQIFKLEMYDTKLKCATPKKFAKNAEEIFKNMPNSDFALVSLTINNFGYIEKRFSEQVRDNLAKFAVNTIRLSLRVQETFGYAGEGEFLILAQFDQKHSFSERLNGLYLKLLSFKGFNDSDYRVSASFAICEVESQNRIALKDLLDRLRIVKESTTVQDGSLVIKYYDEELGRNYIKKAEIEGRMESALKNNEFHLFYQPKYNLRKKTMDGSEILIRWYDNKIEQYRVPAEFLPVFEENGFIVKLDHFVMYKACENIAERVAKRQVNYPISVNVSRVTAIQPDFADYYIRIKNKFGIKDNFITIEFTESFAYENYSFLSQIVQKLHDNGLLCSIDDFGTGYSSYSILKSIRMDEIKLDRFFLSKGVSPERDQTLLKGVIDMVRQLGMKVTQEGVETDEDLFRLQELGCEVIQGYKFAKPMKYVDYCEFIEKNF